MKKTRDGGARPRKRFGQHFLEPAWVRKVVEAIAPAAHDTFLEIGPGRGALTLALAPRVRRIVAIEVDRDLAARLRAAAPPNVTIVQGDVLDADLPALLDDLPARVAGNLPYNIASPIVFLLLRLHRERRPFTDATLLVQREVAERLAASPGTRDYGVLAILVQLHARVTPLLTLPPGAFRPMPRVTSALVRLAFGDPAVPVSSPEAFEALVRAMFLQRRKTLANALARFAARRGVEATDALARARLDPRRRPDTLQLEEIAALAAAFASTGR